jgi:hypothetical protein
MNMDDSVTIIKTGVILTAGGTSVNAAIPTAQSGEIPRYIRLAATTSIYVKLGIAGVAAVAGDFMVQPGDATIVVVPQGITTIACLQAATGGILQVSPLEDC